jgi:site-specific DNA recombinase
MSNVKHPNDDAAVGYLRLSVVRREDPFSPPNQRRLIEQRAEQDGKRIVAWYDDLDKTARKPQVKRPGYQAATEDVLSQRAKTLYVAKLDRLDRRGMGHVGTLLDKVEEAEGQIIFVADGLDTTQPGARQIIAVLAEQARAESDNTSWRWQQFQAYNRRKGIWKRPRPFGYLVVNGKLRPHPIEASIVRCMVDEFLAGASLRGIAHRLNESGVRAPRAVRAAEARAAGRVVKDPPTEEWSYVSVREILIAPSLTAIQAHDRGLFCDDNGELVSVGEGIVTLGERARILAEIERRTALVPQRAGPIPHRPANGWWSPAQVSVQRMDPLRRMWRSVDLGHRDQQGEEQVRPLRLLKAAAGEDVSWVWRAGGCSRRRGNQTLHAEAFHLGAR